MPHLRLRTNTIYDVSASDDENYAITITIMTILEYSITDANLSAVQTGRHQSL